MICEASSDAVFRLGGAGQAVWDKAENLSAQYACLVNCRTLDTLHVATALLLGFRDFVSLDRRQRSLAEHVGLRVKP